MEIWGRCGDCARWFHCPAAGAGEDWACPVCGREPTAIENRAQRARVVRVEELESTPSGR